MVVTVLLSQDVPVEEYRHLVGHSHPSTNEIYDRRRIRRSIVERIPYDRTPGPGRTLNQQCQLGKRR